MTKITMPDPVAWATPEFSKFFGENEMQTLVHLGGSREKQKTFLSVPLITTHQAEAYANFILTPTSKALEVAQVALERICAIDRYGECESIAMDALSDIRALIQKEI